MKLLGFNENKDLKEQENVRQIMRTQELEAAAKKARLELANSQADFQSTLALNRQKWAEEEEEHRQRVNERKTEIDALEAKRMNAMIPVDILKASAEEQLKDAEEYAKSVREREEYAEDLTEKLQTKLDEVGAKEQDLKHKELELNIREQGLENQSQSTISGIKKLSEEMAEFVAYRNQAEASIKEGERALADSQVNLFNREQDLAKLQTSLNEQSIRLQDERGVLDRAFKEVQRMRDNIPLSKTPKKTNNKTT